MLSPLPCVKTLLLEGDRLPTVLVYSDVGCEEHLEQRCLIWGRNNGGMTETDQDKPPHIEWE